MAFTFENAAAAVEGFASLATLKKEEAFSKVEASFHKRMAAAKVKSLKLIISIPAPKKYEYTVVSSNKDLKGSDFKFVWQILKGTNSYTDGIPKWNICTMTVSDGKITSVTFSLAQALLKKYKEAMPKKASTETLDAIQMLMEIDAAYEGLDENLKKLDAVQEVMENLRVASEAVEAFGGDAVSVLNVNKGLENLGASLEKLNDVKAVESLLGDTAKAAWNKLVELIATIVGWIAETAFKIRKWVTSEESRNNMFVQFADGIEGSLFAMKMRLAVYSKLSIESMSIAEMFTNGKIVSYDVALRAMKWGVENNGEGLDLDNHPMTSQFEDFKKVIDEESLESGTDILDALLDEMTKQCAQLTESAEKEHDSFIGLLKSGDQPDKNYYELGWTDAAKVKAFITQYDQAAAKMQGKIDTIKANIKKVEAFEKQLEAKLNKDDALFTKKCDLLRLNLKWEVLLSKSWMRRISNTTLVLTKCRHALQVALSKDVPEEQQ